MGEHDRIYGWIGNVINSCNHPSHIEPCEVLISFYEKKGAEAYLIKSLKESLKIKVATIQEDLKNKKQLTKEEEVWEMFSSGKYTIKQISEITNVKLMKCQEIINKKLK